MPRRVKQTATRFIVVLNSLGLSTSDVVDFCLDLKLFSSVVADLWSSLWLLPRHTESN